MSGVFEQLGPDRVCLDFVAGSAREVLDELARLLGGEDPAVREAVGDGLASREQVSTTAVGGGIAIPHARVDGLPAMRAVFLRVAQPVDFGAVDGRAVDLFVGVAGPTHRRREYLSTLARISYALRSGTVREALRSAGSVDQVRAALLGAESRSAESGASGSP